MVGVVDRYGLFADVPEPEAAAILAEGGRMETPEEYQTRAEAEQYGTLGESLKGIGEAALSGATLGLSDVALSEIGGDEYRAARAARERQLGGLATGAEVVGSIAPLLLSGGSGAVARAGVAVGAPVRGAAAVGRAAEVGTGALLRGAGIRGEGILARGALRGAELGAGGAVEGGLYGAGQALSEAALAPGGNYDKLAEKMWAGAKEGVVFGSIAGGGLGFVGGAGSRAFSRGLERLQGPGALRSMLEDFAAERTVKALGARGTDVRNLGRTIDSTEEQIRRMAADVLEARLDDGTKVFRAGMKADDLAPKVAQARREAGEKLGALRETVKDVEVAIDGLRARVTSEVLAPLQTAATRSVRGRAKRVAGELDALFARDAMTLDDLTRLRMELDSIISPPRPKTRGVAPPPAAPWAADLQKARNLIEDEITEATEMALGARAPELVGQYQLLKGKYRSLSRAEEISTKAAAQDLGNRFASPSDYGTGIATAAGLIAGGAPALVAAAKGAAVSAGHKLVRERGSSVLAVIADRVARSEVRIDKAISGYFKKAGDVRRGAIGHGAAEEVEAKGKISRALAQKKAESQVDAYRRRLKELSSFNPATMETEIGQAAAQAPQVTQATLSSLIRARDYLIKAAPTGLMGNDPLQPHLDKPLPDPVALERFARAVTVVEDPLSVLDDLNDGTITRDQVQTLKAVYPLLYEEVRSKVMAALNETTAKVPYTNRVHLGILMDLPTDTSLTPQRIAATQAVYQQIAAQQPAPPGTPPAQADMPAQLATPAQAAEFGLQEF